MPELCQEYGTVVLVFLEAPAVDFQNVHSMPKKEPAI